MQTQSQPFSPDPDRVKEQQRGRLAQSALSNPVYLEAWASLRKDWLQAWEHSPARDIEAREKLWQAIQILGKVQASMEQVMNTGEMATI